MKGASKAIVGATVLVTVISLAVVFGLVLVLLAELYCSYLLSRRQLIKPESSATIASSDPAAAEEVPSPQLPDRDRSVAASFSSFISHGVLHIPSPFFSKSEQRPNGIEKCYQKDQFPGIHSSPDISTRSSLSECGIVRGDSAREVRCGLGKDQLLVYISNPVFARDSRATLIKDTPFENPETSPSRLEQLSGYSGDEEYEHERVAKKFPSRFVSIPTSLMTPPLTPMKDLPASACSVILRDAGFLVTSGSECNSHHGGLLSSSGTPCTSPSC